jgi:hypothetical protein
MVASLLRWSGTLYFSGLAAIFLLNTPSEMVFEYGIPAGCVGQPRQAFACNVEPTEAEHAQTVIVAMCAVSILGGLSGVWAAWTKDRQAGLAVWLVLVLASTGIACWNLHTWLSVPRDQLLFSPGASIFWCLAYSGAYFWWWRQKPESIS